RHATEFVNRHIGFLSLYRISVLIESLYGPLHVVNDELATYAGFDLAPINVIDFANFYLSDIPVLFYRNRDIWNDSPPVRLTCLHGDRLAADNNIRCATTPCQLVTELKGFWCIRWVSSWSAVLGPLCDHCDLL